MDHDADNRVTRRRKGRPPANTLRYAVMLTLNWDDDRQIIDVLLGLPRGARSALLKEALRFYIESGEITLPAEDSENHYM